MPRRPGRTSAAGSAHLPTPEQATSQTPSTCLDENLAILRTQWKWAVFSQFITTFSPLLNMADVTVTDIEHDLAFGSKKVVSRVMQRLLYTLSYDRKISLDNWQSALRKQYLKRDPLSNPLGLEPPKEQGIAQSREGTPDTHEIEAVKEDPDMGPLDTPSKTMDSESKPPDQSATASEFSRAPTQEAEVENAANASGENQASLDWFDLPMLVKLDSLHLLTEWQFQNPTRLRAVMRSDDELATWRHEPIGYDSKKNAYWLIGGDRLWIQRVPPRPPKSLKRKRIAETRTISESSHKTKLSKRPRTKAALTRPDNASKSVRQGRAAKLQAKLKLDAQAKALAEMNRQAKHRVTRTSTRSSNSAAKAVSRPLGTRVSARLRGTQVNEWQAIPDGWLDDSIDPEYHVPSDEDNKDSVVSNQAHENDHDSISELTELSDESDAPDDPSPESPQQQEPVDSSISTSIGNSVRGDDLERPSPSHFVEWETICVVLEEWERVAERFEKATHYSEKALYKYLTTEIVPNLTQILKETERKRRLEEAFVHRKRSSRIAIKESEREEARLAVQRQADEDAKMGRAKRLEARRQREEEERLHREQAREQRRKEREVRELRRQVESEQEDYTNDTEKQDSRHTSKPTETSPAPPKARRNGKAQDLKERPRTTKPGDWELDCEICGKKGVNLDDGTPMMSCGMCLKWQHIRCHDEVDQRGGRSKRNWDVVEFICQQCRSKMFEGPGPGNSSLRDPRSYRLSHGGNLQQPYHNSVPYQTYSSQSYGGARPPGTIPAPYHAPNGNYSHYTQTHGNTHAGGSSDHYPNPSPSFAPMHHYSQPSTTISFSHYQPQEGSFSSNTRVQPLYTDAYGRHLPSSRHVPYSDLRSSTNQKVPAAQTVWNITTPATAGSYTTSYQSGMHNAAISRRETQPGPPLPELNHTSYPNAQFRYHSTA